MDKGVSNAFAILQVLAQIASSCITEELEGQEHENRMEIYRMTIDVSEALHTREVFDGITNCKNEDEAKEYASFETPVELMMASPIFRGVQSYIETVLR